MVISVIQTFIRVTREITRVTLLKIIHLSESLLKLEQTILTSEREHVTVHGARSAFTGLRSEPQRDHQEQNRKQQHGDAPQPGRARRAAGPQQALGADLLRRLPTGTVKTGAHVGSPEPLARPGRAPRDSRLGHCPDGGAPLPARPRPGLTGWAEGSTAVRA